MLAKNKQSVVQLGNKWRISIAEQVSCGCIIVDVIDDIKNVRLFPSAFLPKTSPQPLYTCFKGPPTLTCRWEAEPGEWRWVIDRQDEAIRVRIFWFTQTDSHKSDEEGELVFDTTGDVWRFAASWRDQIAQLPQPDAEGCPPFSPDAFAKLNALLRERKRLKRKQYVESKARKK